MRDGVKRKLSDFGESRLFQVQPVGADLFDAIANLPKRGIKSHFKVSENLQCILVRILPQRLCLDSGSVQYLIRFRLRDDYLFVLRKRCLGFPTRLPLETVGLFLGLSDDAFLLLLNALGLLQRLRYADPHLVNDLEEFVLTDHNFGRERDPRTFGEQGLKLVKPL